MNGRWKGWGVSQRGPLHIKNSIPNQDSFILKTYTWGAAAAVCDGLGSKPHSHIGSKKLCEAFIQTVKMFEFEKDLSFFEKIMLPMWEMKISPIQDKDALSTIIFTIIKDKKVYIANSGDGGIVILGKKELVFEDSGEFSNITTPFGYQKLNWRMFDEDDIDAVMLCSDGIYDDLQKNRIKDFAKDYINHYKNIPPLKRYFEIKRFLKNWPIKGHTDDKTILTLYKDENA